MHTCVIVLSVFFLLQFNLIPYLSSIQICATEVRKTCYDSSNCLRHYVTESYWLLATHCAYPSVQYFVYVFSNSLVHHFYNKNKEKHLRTYFVFSKMIFCETALTYKASLKEHSIRTIDLNWPESLFHTKQCQYNINTVPLSIHYFKPVSVLKFGKN